MQPLGTIYTPLQYISHRWLSGVLSPNAECDRGLYVVLSYSTSRGRPLQAACIMEAGFFGEAGEHSIKAFRYASTIGHYLKMALPVRASSSSGMIFSMPSTRTAAGGEYIIDMTVQWIILA